MKSEIDEADHDHPYRFQQFLLLGFGQVEIRDEVRKCCGIESQRGRMMDYLTGRIGKLQAG